MSHQPRSPNYHEVWVIVAAYREATALPAVLKELHERFSHVLVVDDGSPDETAEVALQNGATVVRHPINRGQGAALQTGIAHALRQGAAVLVTYDADGQHRVDDAVRLLQALNENDADVALGSRFLQHGSDVPWRRKLLLTLAVAFTRAATGLRVSDTHNGLRAFRRRAAAQLDLRMDRMAHASELLDQIRAQGTSFVEVPVHVRYTTYSMAKGQSASAAVRVLWEYLWGRFLR